MAAAEAVTAADAPADQGQDHAGRERGSNRIQISSSKKPMFFYVNLSKRLLGEHGEVHLSALGMAVSTMVSIAEILKKDGLAVESRLATSMDLLGDGRQRPVQKAKMEVWLKKSDQFDALVAAEKASGGGAGTAAEEGDHEHGAEEGEEEEHEGDGEEAS